MPINAFVFQCNSNTYQDCIQKGLFGSNLPWSLKVRKGDLCLLNHLEIHSVFMLWQAECNGSKNIVSKAWNGRFPFQARVKLVSSEILEVPRVLVNELLIDPTTGFVVNEIVPQNLPSMLKSIDEQLGLSFSAGLTS